jgi:PAS domain S-box-containing protein
MVYFRRMAKNNGVKSVLDPRLKPKKVKAMKNAYPKIEDKENGNSHEPNNIDKNNGNLSLLHKDDFFQVIADNVNDIILHGVFTPDLQYDYVSPSCTHISGYTPEEFYADALLPKKITVPEDYPLVEASNWNTSAKNTPFEIRWIHKNGRIIWTEHLMTLTVDKDGNPVGFTVIARDITERKQTEAAYQESQKFSTSLLENAPHATVVFNADTSVKYVNPAWERINGWTLEEVVGKKAPNYPWWLEEQKESFLEPFMQTMKKGGSGNSEIFAQKKNGEIYWIAMNWVSVENNGELAYMIINSVDITDRKKMEVALKESEEKFSKAFSSSPNPVCIVTVKEGAFLEVNESFLHFSGYTREEVIGHTPVELNLWINKDDEEKMGKSLKETGKVDLLEIRSRMKSGEVRTGLFSAEEIEIGGVKCITLVITDVTEGKKAQEALRESEEKFSKAFLASPSLISISRMRDGKFIEINDTFLRDKGYTREEVIGHTATELNIYTNKDDYATIRALLNRQGKFINRETRYLTKSGQKRVGLMSAEIINIGDEPCMIVVHTDITEQKDAEQQLKLLSSVTEQVSDAIVIADPGYNITYINKATEKMFGYTLDEVKGQKLAFFTKQKATEAVSQSVAKTLKAGKVYSTTFTKYHKNGSTIICDCRLSPLYDDKGQICSLIDVHRDVTKQKEVETKLQAHQKLIDSILDNTPQGVLVIDKENRVLLANKALQNIFNLDSRTLKNKLLKEIFPTDHFFNLHKAVESAGVEKQSVEFRYLIEEQQKIIHSIVVTMDGDRIILTFSDISREREEEEKLYLTDRLASLGEMAAGLAHELNNPLTGILALSQLLMSDNLPAEQKEDIECIHTEANRASNIVKNVLLFARNKIGDNGQSSPNDVLKDVLKLREYDERINNISVVTNLEENLPNIPLDKGQLQQVFLNMISNAEAAIKEIHNSGTITITTQRVNNHVNIIFSDDGCGIKKQIMPRIFDPFFTTKEIGKGTGLGLSICYSTIVKHGGKINVKSQVNEGTTFTIRMPIVTE